MPALLEVKDLMVEAFTKERSFKILEDFSFTVERNGITALVGESGCGKSITSFAIMGLLPPNVRITGGTITLDGARIENLSPRKYRELRGRRAAMIFQEPMSSLNPLITAGEQIAEIYRIHFGYDRAAAKRMAIEMLDRVRMSDASKRARQYPHEMSGGMRQRVMIAMALACSPQLLIADEPTTALDVTVQAQILDLLREIMDEQRKEGRDTGILLITHDMGVVAETADSLVVMYSGQGVELGRVEDVFQKPHHPYTEGLLAAIPRIDSASLIPIPGTVPKPWERPPNACVFAPRCKYVFDECWKKPVPLFDRSVEGSTVSSRCLLEELS